MDAAASAFVAAHADAEALESGKIRCTVTGHEMRPILSELEAHWASKTYLKKKERAEYDFDQHAPWLVPHKSDPHLLWCTITEHPVSRQPKAVEAHVSGKRFRRMKKEWKAQQKAKKAQEAARAEKRAAREARLAGGAPADGDGEEDGSDWEDLGDGAEEGAEAAAAGADDDDDMDDDDDDAAEFLAEGAFWEEGEEEEEGEEDAEMGSADEDEFWVRGANSAPKVEVQAPTQRAKKPKAERATLQKKKPEKARPAPQKLGGKRRKPGASS